MILLATLGMFVFNLKTIPFSGYNRSQNWKHPHQSVVGTAPPSQYTGKDPEEITLDAELRPEVTGSTKDIEALRLMANTGEPYPLILGNGKLLGSFVITSISEKNSQLNEDGSPRAISFSLGLKKVSDSALGINAQGLQVAVSTVRNLIGI